MNMFLAIASLAAAVLAAKPAFAAAPADGVTYCTAKGGAVQVRQPFYGTNGGTPLQLAGKRNFCQFTSKDGTTHIDLLASTLATGQPTLAALAYYAEVPYDGSSCQGSPGSCYCSQLGGTDLFGGVNAAGGGWVNEADGTDVLDACIFPDLSSIDSYGLFYHSANIIRGKNLAHVLRYKNPNKTR